MDGKHSSEQHGLAVPAWLALDFDRSSLARADDTRCRCRRHWCSLALWAPAHYMTCLLDWH